MDYVAENAAARNRILSLVAGLTDAEIAIPSDDGWTIGAQLAHLAFWDRVHSGRLRASLDSGGDLPGSFPPGAVDEINNAGLEAWRLIPGTAAIRWFAEASSEVDAYLASLDPSVVESHPVCGPAAPRRAASASDRPRRRDRTGPSSPVTPGAGGHPAGSTTGGCGRTRTVTVLVMWSRWKCGCLSAGPTRRGCVRS